MFAVVLLMFVAGLAGFAIRLIPEWRARRRSRSAARAMARKLRISVRHQNAQQSINALREKREVEVQPLESAMACRADLRRRIETIRLWQASGSMQLTAGLAEIPGK